MAKYHHTKHSTLGKTLPYRVLGWDYHPTGTRLVSDANMISGQLAYDDMLSEKRKYRECMSRERKVSLESARDKIMRMLAGAGLGFDSDLGAAHRISGRASEYERARAEAGNVKRDAKKSGSYGVRDSSGHNLFRNPGDSR